jgi:GTP cyclohydrolase I
MKVFTHREVKSMALDLSEIIKKDYLGKEIIKAYPVPRGGVPAAYAIASFFPDRKQQFRIVETPEEADIFIDDLIDSGETSIRFEKTYPNKPFHVLYDKRNVLDPNEWIVWPWESTSESSIEENIKRLLQYIGEDCTREGLKETPRRVAKAWKEWTTGYAEKPEDALKCFEDGADGCDEMVIQKDIPFYSHCEHHMAPFFGTISIAYIPKGKIVGLSKLTRLANVFVRRLQVQERLTNQIANALEVNLKPLGVGVVIKARHLCQESRGIEKQGLITITSAVRGALREKPEAREEFMLLVR